MSSTIDTLLSAISLSLRDIVLLLTAAVGGFVLTVVLERSAHWLSGRARVVVSLTSRARRAGRFLLPALAMSAVVAFDAGDEVPGYITRTLAMASVALFGWFAIALVQGLVEHIVQTHTYDHADNFEARQIQTQIRVLGRVVIFVIVITTVAGVLVTIPTIRNVGVSLFASAGIAGLAIGLAARPALTNLIAGIQLALTQPIRLEDAVVVEGEWGWVEEINLTFVVIRIWDLRRLVLPISYFIEKPFQNWTRTTADILGSVMLYMDYSVSVDEIRSEFKRALRDSKYWDQKVEVVHVTDCTERTMQIRLLMSARNSPDCWELRCEVRERLIAYLQARHPDALPRIRLDGPQQEPQSA
jgi:small-conductance mechanosensitive channel